MGQIFNIPAQYGFAETLVADLTSDPDPFHLADTHIYLPTRRAVRILQAAFAQRVHGKSLILPRLHAIGDMDADEIVLSGDHQIGLDALSIPPPMAPSQRLFLMARLIDHGWDQILGLEKTKSMTQVFAYARALVSLLDTVETEGLDLSALSGATPTDTDFEGFWERAGRFISLIQNIWPDIEAEAGRISIAQHRRRFLELKATEWYLNPPAHQLILAGTTATIPAVADLAEIVLSLPMGRLILPGLDLNLDSKTWAQIIDQPSHPQHGMARLLKRLKIEPTEVPLWPGCDGTLNFDRHAALSYAQRPPGTTPAEMLKPFDLSGLALVEASSPELEARTIAVFLREALEEPTASAALVTPDQDLAGRVKAELRRWGIDVDVSAGSPLLDSSLGRLAQLSLQCLGEEICVSSLVGLYAHPFVTWGLPDRTVARSYGQDIDLITRGMKALRSFEDVDWPDHPISPILCGFWQQAPKDSMHLRDWLKRHLDFLEILCPDSETLWAGTNGEGLAHLFEDLQAHGVVLPRLSFDDYESLFASFLRESIYRKAEGHRARVAILGTLEARLLRVDTLALGGLNEGTWPKETDIGPWMNRPTRAKVGLPSPERKVGLAAHDLAQSFGSGRILMTRTTRVDGTPTLSSRWIERLKTLTAQVGQADVLTDQGRPYLQWAQDLDQVQDPPIRPFVGVGFACPPVLARPKKLYATDIGLLVANPYAFYAKRVLKLRALLPRGPQPNEQIWGSLIHDLLDTAVRENIPTLENLISLGQERLKMLDLEPSTNSIWKEQLAHCLAEFWSLNKTYISGCSKTEIEGQMLVSGTRVVGRADRVVQSPGKIQVLDYKTGQMAGDLDQRRGLDPQLAVLGLIAELGGFEGVSGGIVGQSFIGLPKRGFEQGREKVIDDQVRPDVWQGLKVLIQAYADPEQAYLSAPFGDKVGKADPKYDDYIHLARRIIS